MSTHSTAAAVVVALQALASPTELVKVRKRLAPDEPAIGLRMRDVFDVAKEATAISGEEWARLVAEPAYEARLAAFAILDFQARLDLGSAALCRTYLSHHDRISTWDMVDRAAPRVVGASLAGGSYELLHRLADDADPLRRRTAITAPLWFARYGDQADVAAGFEIAALLCTDPDPTVHKPVGIFLAHAGKREHASLVRFLDQHAAGMPATAVRLAKR